MALVLRRPGRRLRGLLEVRLGNRHAQWPGLHRRHDLVFRSLEIPAVTDYRFAPFAVSGSAVSGSAVSESAVLESAVLGSDLYYILRSVARPLRVEYPGAVYHVSSRGHERSSIFRDDEDRKSFLKIFRTVAADQGWLVHAYCLIGNHYHLLLETRAANLSLGMRSLNSRYGQKFNRRHGRSGHVLEGRYKAILVQKESHLLELHRYVVLNPVRARLVRRPGEWPWSNYRATSGRSAVPPWLEVDWTLSQFGLRRGAAREAYRRFVLAGKGLPSPLEDVKGQI